MIMTQWIRSKCPEAVFSTTVINHNFAGSAVCQCMFVDEASNSGLCTTEHVVAYYVSFCVRDEPYPLSGQFQVHSHEA